MKIGFYIIHIDQRSAREKSSFFNPFPAFFETKMEYFRISGCCLGVYEAGFLRKFFDFFFKPPQWRKDFIAGEGVAFEK